MPRRFTTTLARLGTPTGDKRILTPGGISSRDLPLPLMWQRESSEGHGGSIAVGRIETLDIGQDMVTATGTLLESAEWSYELIEQLDAGILGPSVDLDDLEYVIDDEDRIIITKARIAGATLVNIPAFADVSIHLAPLPVVTEESLESKEIEAVDPYLYASADVSRETLPPAEWFRNPNLKMPTPLTITNEGRVMGHIAQWGVCHIGLPGCVTPPPSETGYAHFLTKEQPLSDGTVVRAGVLTAGGGHAEPGLGIRPASEHYEDPDAAVAKVFAGEDEHGIWVSGWVLPYAKPERVQQLKDLDVSGDWRRTGGSLELIAACAVNTAGFPVLRKVAFSLERGGQQTLIGQFGVSRETSATPQVTELRIPSPSSAAARAQWAKMEWKLKTEGDI